MSILFPILLVAGLGLIAGVGLAVASVVMAVPVDEKAQAVKEVLPGANCGACGFSGCEGYANALSAGEAKNGLCAPGGSDVANAIAGILGLEAASEQYKTAFVHCLGACQKTSKKMDYAGIQTCAAASMQFGGDGACSYGCLGFGDCMRSCPYGAISLCNGIAVVNPAACKACTQCVSACPKHLITIVTAPAAAQVGCSNHDKGGETRKQCTAGCIGCMRCVKSCEFGAVTVHEFLATVDPEKCTACGKCAEVCPSQCIELLNIKQLQKA
nr:RnfABCDGE type electron transport complex subunit B [uncultured Solibaculum sp.]